MNKIENCPVHLKFWKNKVKVLINTIGQRVWFISTPNWELHIDLLNPLAHKVLWYLDELNFDKLWEITIKRAQSHDWKLWQVLLAIVWAYLWSRIDKDPLDKKIIRYFQRQYYFLYGWRKLSEEDTKEQIISVFTSAVSDCIAMRYLQDSMSFWENKGLWLLYANMYWSDSSDNDSLVSQIILWWEYGNNYYRIVERIKEVSQSWRINACPFYLSKDRKNWIEKVYAKAGEIDFKR